MSATTTTAARWDCHAHLFGPYAQFPLAADRSYTPPEAVDTQYQALLQRLGLTHGVLVHPSAYGDDFSLLFHALETHENLRGVVVLTADTKVDIGGLRARGVRAARFSHRGGANFAGSASIDDLHALSPRLADAGLHAELWTDAALLSELAPRLKGLPFPVVIDHMGGFDVDAGIDAPGFRALLSLVESGTAWVKLCAYRNLFKASDFEQGRPFHEALLQANPEALVWGSDWPHLRVTPEPDAADLLAACRRWSGEAAMTRILETNPAKLYT